MTSSNRKLRFIPLTAIIFFTVSGGPYGLEPLVSYTGFGSALFLLMIVPLLWDIPTILTVFELNGMMPVKGGYYQWVKRALGLRFAFYNGWWTWLYSFVDLAIYPLLFIQYASFFIPAIAVYKIPLCLIIIWSGAWLNIRGLVPVGKMSLLLSTVVLVPFILLFAKSFLDYKGITHLPEVSFKEIESPSLGMAIYTVMWNFIGWDSATTYAEEVHQPARTYIISTLIAFIGICSVYILSILVTQRSGIDVHLLTQQGFPVLGVKVWGKWLGVLLAIGGMASSLGIFFSVLLSTSRLPKVMADDHLLPAKLQTEHPKYKTPYLSILVSAAIVSGMIFWTFADLIFIDVSLYSAGLLLEFISLLVFRIKAPDQYRPFKIPLNITGICLMIVLPLSVLGFAIGGICMTNNRNFSSVVFALLALLSAEIIWQFIQIYRKLVK